MIRALLDSNVLVSGIVRRHPDAPSVQIVESWRAGRFELVVCEHILEEVARTLAKPYFAARLSEQRIERALLLLRRHAFLTPLAANVEGVATRAEDDAVLDAAVSAGAAFLATGDLDLLALGTYEGVDIRTPRDFAEILHEGVA